VLALPDMASTKDEAANEARVFVRWSRRGALFVDAREQGKLDFLRGAERFELLDLSARRFVGRDEADLFFFSRSDHRRGKFQSLREIGELASPGSAGRGLLASFQIPRRSRHLVLLVAATEHPGVEANVSERRAAKRITQDGPDGCDALGGRHSQLS
jgi:hypothetical protein